ncbi:hypothetical protein [Ancylobacter amanitiformis]|uniref:TRAP-type C4-dicarboxylate transport system permease small subunit n=1 Tax=Ancylobacter amanitiformis TaxID=217069 RepID=A0ABU0LLI0_9HYPH|nr:hypothetical protein [Ancylobacter amanitiformis]MDQ0509557.1 TRAP-type C4-dicarboxylate transport system permease small subunit [Ancylobacter amanitiformis]
MTRQMTTDVAATTVSPSAHPGSFAAEPRHTAGRRLSRALMEAGVVLSLTFAIVAVLCMFGLQRASALDLSGMPAQDGRIAMGAVLLALFVGLCGLTSFMLRSTLNAADGPRSRRG